MGADGHIKIYSMEKLKAKYDDEVIESFFGHFSSSTMYKQTLEGRQYLTRYWGDNLWSNDLFDVVLYCYDNEKDEINKESYKYDSYSGDYFMKLSKGQRETFYDLVMYLENKCSLTSWEIWT